MDFISLLIQVVAAFVFVDILLIFDQYCVIGCYIDYLNTDVALNFCKYNHRLVVLWRHFFALFVGLVG